KPKPPSKGGSKRGQPSNQAPKNRSSSSAPKQKPSKRPSGNSRPKRGAKPRTPTPKKPVGTKPKKPVGTNGKAKPTRSLMQARTNHGVYRLGKYRYLRGKGRDVNAHHGVMTAWMKVHFSRYNRFKAPAIQMPASEHRATYRIYDAWRKTMKRKM